MTPNAATNSASTYLIESLPRTRRGFHGTPCQSWTPAAYAPHATVSEWAREAEARRSAQARTHRIRRRASRSEGRCEVRSPPDRLDGFPGFSRLRMSRSEDGFAVTQDRLEPAQRAGDVTEIEPDEAVRVQDRQRCRVRVPEDPATGGEDDLRQ